MSLKKIALSTLSLVVVAAMSACSTSTMTPSVASVKATSDLTFASNIKPGTFDPVTNSTFVADIGNGKKGATINFTIGGSDSFKTKATNGTAPVLKAAVASIVISLLKNGTPVASATSVTLTTGLSTPKTYNFTNCDAGIYTVRVENVFDSVPASIIGSGAPFVSTATTVDAFNQISGSSTVTVPLKNGTPASIDATITAQDGITPTGAVVIS